MVAVLAAGFAFCGPTAAAETPTSLDSVKLVGAEEAKRMLDKGVMLVDTRVASEFEEKTIKGAKNVPYREKSAKSASFDKAQDQFDLSKLPGDKNAPVVFFCNAGECWKSYKASVVARDAGYKQIHWLRGGLPEWVAKGLPTQ
jgi:rhodanese-related sulfurtransferase